MRVGANDAKEKRLGGGLSYRGDRGHRFAVFGSGTVSNNTAKLGKLPLQSTFQPYNTTDRVICNQNGRKRRPSPSSAIKSA